MRSSLETLLNRLIERYEPEKVILFGSAARGGAVEESDIDLIIIKQTERRFLDRLADALIAMKADRAVDVLVYTPQEFEKMRAEENPFLEHALKGGKELYVRSTG